MPKQRKHAFSKEAMYLKRRGWARVWEGTSGMFRMVHWNHPVIGTRCQSDALYTERSGEAQLIKDHHKERENKK